MTPFALDALPRVPWRNCAGWTRTVCAHTVNGQVLWRVNVADITAAAPFSQFAGMDRTAVMVKGGRLQLSNADVQLQLEGIGSQIQFPGELALHCAKPQDTTQLLNIMVRRGQAIAQVQVVENEAFALTPGGEQLVLVLRDSFKLRSSAGRNHTLRARFGMHWLVLQEDWRVQPLGVDDVMVICTLGCVSPTDH